MYGINSAGKSSFMKQIGIAIIMAQAGLFVPAQSCVLSPYKSIYTRIIGNDNIYKGLSSFVLEMLEVKAILRRANENTLVIGDEVCRSTESISANAIVSSTIIHLSKVKSTFIFATHFHEIAEMKRIKDLTNVKAVHLSVAYDSVNDVLVYNRLIKDGQGEKIYGITVAKYIIQDKEFNELTNEIKNELTSDYGTLLTDKRSKYNSEVFIHECQLCHCKNIKGKISNLETHHINFQKNCKNGFVDDKQYIKKNDVCNLIILCADCHDKIHAGEIKVDGYIMTTKGRQIKTQKINKILNN
jgi:DNA mismatch repair protein MutS